MLLSPIDPDRNPRKRFHKSGISPERMSASGVAAVIASTFMTPEVPNAPVNPAAPATSVKAGTIHAVVRTVGKVMYIKRRPVIAGLKMLRPNPPNTSFAIATAKTIPTTAIQTGVTGGSDSEYSAHVTSTASLTFFLRLFSKKYSVAIPKANTNAVVTMTRHPYKNIANRNMGTSEYITRLIMSCFWNTSPPFLLPKQT